MFLNIIVQPFTEVRGPEKEEDAEEDEEVGEDVDVEDKDVGELVMVILSLWPKSSESLFVVERKEEEDEEEDEEEEEEDELFTSVEDEDEEECPGKDEGEKDVDVGKEISLLPSSSSDSSE